MSRQTLITFQPAPIVDHVTEDGTELTQLPYPVHAWADNGRVPDHLGGYTEPLRIAGFTRTRDRGQLDASWQTIAYNPQDAVGMFIVCQLPDGNLNILTSPVRDVQVREFERPDTIDPLSAVPDSERRREGWT